MTRSTVTRRRRPGPAAGPLSARWRAAASRTASVVAGADVAAGDHHGGQRAGAAGPGPGCGCSPSCCLPGRRRRGGGRGRARGAAALPGRWAAPAQAPGLGGGGRGDRGGGAVPPGQGARRRGGRPPRRWCSGCCSAAGASSGPRPTRAGGGWRCGGSSSWCCWAPALGMLLLQAYSGPARRPALAAHAADRGAARAGRRHRPGRVRLGPARRTWSGATLLGFGLLTAFVTAYFALRPAEPVGAAGPERRAAAARPARPARPARLARLLRAAPGQERGVLAVGKAAVSYRVLHGVLLASGDPVGDPEAWPGAIEATLRLARRYAWTPAVIGCGERGATVWTRSGLGAYELGDEAVLDLPAFSLDGRPMRGIRQAVARVQRAGVTVDGPACARRPAGRAGRAGGGRGRLARQRGRARLLDGAVPARRPHRSRLRAGHGPRGRTGRCAACCTSSRGGRTGCRWI